MFSKKAEIPFFSFGGTHAWVEMFKKARYQCKGLLIGERELSMPEYEQDIAFQNYELFKRGLYEQKRGLAWKLSEYVHDLAD